MGASVMSGSSRGVQAIVKNKYSSAAYVHCHAHQLNLILLKAASVNRSVRIFFANLQGICAFFSTSPQRTSILNEVVKKRLPRAVPTRWNFQSRSINTIFEYRTELIDCMTEIQNGDQITNNNTIMQASGHEKMLSDVNFVFWLTFFSKIMPQVDILYNQLQKRNTDAALVKKKKPTVL